MVENLFTEDGKTNPFAICEHTFKWILEHIPKGSTIVELGSGTGTKELCKHYTVYSVEDNLKWVNYVNESNYIHAPLISYGDHMWFNESIIKERLPSDYSFLLIDGPHAHRVGFHKHINLFNQTIPWIFDDTHADHNLLEAIKCSELLKRPYKTYQGVIKKFTIIK